MFFLANKKHIVELNWIARNKKFCNIKWKGQTHKLASSHTNQWQTKKKTTKQNRLFCCYFFSIIFIVFFPSLYFFIVLLLVSLFFCILLLRLMYFREVLQATGSIMFFSFFLSFALLFHCFFFSFHFTYRLLFILTWPAWLMRKTRSLLLFSVAMPFSIVKMVVCVHLRLVCSIISIGYSLDVIVRFSLLCFALFCLPAITLVFWFNVINFKQRLNAEKNNNNKLLHLHPNILENNLTITITKRIARASERERMQ